MHAQCCAVMLLAMHFVAFPVIYTWFGNSPCFYLNLIFVSYLQMLYFTHFYRHFRRFLDKCPFSKIYKLTRDMDQLTACCNKSFSLYPSLTPRNCQLNKGKSLRGSSMTWRMFVLPKGRIPSEYLRTLKQAIAW
jgi:hypothetical protein